MKLLSDIVYKAGIEEVAGSMHLAISSIAFDSRKADRSGLFIAVKGIGNDGHDFIEKAILHYSYIESDVGITLGDEFVFKNETKKMENVLFSNENFIKTFKNIFENDLSEFLIYNIQI